MAFSSFCFYKCLSLAWVAPGLNEHAYIRRLSLAARVALITLSCGLCEPSLQRCSPSEAPVAHLSNRARVIGHPACKPDDGGRRAGQQHRPGLASAVRGRVGDDPSDSQGSQATSRRKAAAPSWLSSFRAFLQLALHHSYIPNAGILDEEEFGESSASRAQDAELTAAEELGLMDRSDESQLLLVQLPCSLPLPMQPQSVSEPNKGSKETGEGMKLKELPAGYMGKILVYRSGKVKMKIGDTLFDVSSGSDCKFVQEVAAINTREKHCCTVGEISKRAVITPNIGCLLGSANKMEE
ncbi:hypothetical protein C2845_PM16G06070 [Panicum miliaceum]|uniref:DNA-directed RNA polymerase III subunit RPC4 n=1 Tax=Panicum miliaceum TaxID=4540 RepID=A0A3L6PRI9_PANMI|nr:hypothetical protein C2845_PM16G06070 [Panicum miliaceum]